MIRPAIAIGLLCITGLGKGAKVYGVVTLVDDGSKTKGQAALSVTLTDMQVGGKVLSSTTKPVGVAGGKGTGTKKIVGARRSAPSPAAAKEPRLAPAWARLPVASPPRRPR